jgi:flagellar transcriptional activator FlhD
MADHHVNDIGDLNLSYLLLAQRMVKDDAATAMYRLGISREMAELLGSLTLSQIVRMASSNLVLCRFRFDEQPLLAALTDEKKSLPLQQAHAAILLSGLQASQAVQAQAAHA